MATFARRHPPPIKARKGHREYREEVREDFRGCCAHCGVHESYWWHDQKIFEIDHFKPCHLFRKLAIEHGKPKFAYRDLQDDFYNLRWCCRICNSTDGKGEAWPSKDEEAKGIGFVDLTEDNWQDHYKILSNGLLDILTTKADYTVKAIGLNNVGYVRHRLEIISAGHCLFQAPE